MNANDTRNPDEIERDIRATQRDMSATVNKLEEQLTPRNIMNTLLDKSDENGIDGRYLLDQARRNPIALGMIAVGGLWLVSDSDARMTSVKSGFGLRSGSKNKSRSNRYHPDEDFHAGYVEHMRLCEHRADEDWEAWRRRRDQHRASYLMVEPRHDEDEHSFRKRLDEATESMRQRRDSAAEQARNFATKTYEGAANAAHQTYDGAGRLAHDAYEGGQQLASKARRAYSENPMIGGLAAALVGAVAGSLLPVTRTEEEQFGRMGADTLDMAKDKARQAGNQAKDVAHNAAEHALDKKDELVDKADQQMREGGQSSGSGQSSGQSSGQQTTGRQFGNV